MDLKACLPQAALAFRGYNITNLGRTTELLEHRAYGPVVQRHLHHGSKLCRKVTGKRVNLAARVRSHKETTLRSYHEAVAMIMAVELAQLDLLREFHGIEYQNARLIYGYSLGEVSALAATGVFAMESSLEVLLSLASDAVELSQDVTLGVLFSRGPELPSDEITRQCLRINLEGRGVIGVSTYLSPNSLLLLGQRDTLDRFKKQLDDVLTERIYLRKNKHRWPPLHTPIMWERSIPNRSALLMHTIEGGFSAPKPPLLSMVTGEANYNDHNARDILRRWIDHPQRLWEVVYETLRRGIETVIHVGPEPNLLPATFERLRVDVEGQTRGSLSMRALSGIVRRPWLSALLPSRAALLRVPLIRHVNLEDWLLDNPPQ